MTKQEQRCIFCDIASAKESSYKILENDKFIVILDAFPITEGHTLVIPKSHKKDVLELTRQETADLFTLARDIAGVLVKQLEADSVNIATAPSVVPHFHLHIIPRYLYDMMGPLADLDNKRELPKEVMERIQTKIKEGVNALKEV